MRAGLEREGREGFGFGFLLGGRRIERRNLYYETLNMSREDFRILKVLYSLRLTLKAWRVGSCGYPMLSVWALRGGLGDLHDLVNGWVEQMVVLTERVRY